MINNVNKLLISIVLTTYKRSHLLMRAIDSILNGGFDNFELIIVNDCSPDNTDEIVSKIRDSRVKYIKLEQNCGVLVARNRGFDICHGDLITILDDDDILVSGALEQVVNAYVSTKPEKQGILWFDCIDKESGKISGLMPIKEGAVLFEDYVCGRIQGDFWLVFEKRVLEKMRFDERLRANESLFWMKLHRLFPAVYFPIVLCEKYREHGERLCDLHARLGQLPQNLIALTEFQKQFGHELKRLCPIEYGRKLAYLGFHQLMNGDFKSGRKSILTSLCFRFSMKYLFLYILSFFIVKSLVKKIYIYSER